jgi:hypothetical protein
MGSPCDRPFCQQRLRADTTLLQLGRLRQPRRGRRSVPEVGLSSRVRLPTNHSPQEIGEEAGDVKRHLHPGLSPLGSPDMASVASDVEGPRGSPPAFHGRLSDRFDDRQAAPNPSQPPFSRLEDLWRINSLQDLPGNTKDILKAGWRQSTEDRYDRAWQSLKRHLRSANVPVNQVGVKHILNYIARLHNLGLAIRTISLHRSTISMILPYVNGAAVGSHPLVSRMCKGSFEKSTISLGPYPSLRHFHALAPSPELRPAREEVRLHFSYPFW